jgi:phage tail-like protein
MARHRIADYLQNHRFWLMDMVPSATFPFLVLGTPLLGFQSITAPEYTADVDEIKEMNSMFKKHVYSGGSVGPMTLTRGVRGYDDTFWQWMMRAMRGWDVTPRHLLLVHFTSIGATTDDIGVKAWEAIAFLPGKAWILWDSIPTRYKAGSDFDAMGGEVSLSELEIQPHAMTELTLLSPL